MGRKRVWADDKMRQAAFQLQQKHPEWTQQDIKDHLLKGKDITPTELKKTLNHTDSSKSTICTPSRHTSANDPSITKLEEADMPADFVQKVKMIQYAQTQGVEIRLNELCTWEKQHAQDSEQQLAQQAATSQISDLLTIIKPKNSLPKLDTSISTISSAPSNSHTS